MFQTDLLSIIRSHNTVNTATGWIKIDQLDVTCFIISLFTAQYVSNVSTSIFRSLRLIVDLFHVLYCSGWMCVCVTVWFGWGGMVSLYRLKHCFSLYKDTTPPQPNHIITPTHIEPEQYNPWNKSTISRKLLKVNVLTFETYWAVNSEIIKQVTSSWSIFIQHIVSFSPGNHHMKFSNISQPEAATIWPSLQLGFLYLL
jgi:fucose 4-O-acetylase-like acetyltransferase